MKVNLLYGGSSISGYTNVDHLGLAEGAYHGNVCDLTEFVDDSEAIEILAVDVINFFNKNNILSIIDHWVSKLRHGGKIIIGAADAHCICKSFCEYDITIAEINSMLYGEEEPYIRKNAITMMSLAYYLESNHGLKIIKKQSIEYKILIEAERL
tara:strand:+ start:4308 stop:4769 length:462 start_codon:yes stop_codon:yes gene_type:complete